MRIGGRFGGSHFFGKKMKTRTAKADFQYKLSPVKVGQPLEVDDNDVDVMLKCGWIEPEKGEPGYAGESSDWSGWPKAARGKAGGKKAA